MFKKDHIWLGMLIGAVLPLIFFAVLYLISGLLSPDSYMAGVLSLEKILLISIFINLIPVRYYFVSLRYDLTGRGLILITFALVFIYFIFLRHFIG